MHGLRDACATKRQAGPLRKAQARRSEQERQLKARIEQHLEQPRGQQYLVGSCIERLAARHRRRRTQLATGPRSARPWGVTTFDEVVEDVLAS
ncbi:MULTISPECIES: DUF892 family protein [Xanthomonas]|uniref:DUF892 family protein n=1 Tax=Xanthomonas TaxID=338 RepID=UPI002356BBA7|nr:MULTISPECIES: DUF892 family protein [Xanthomonas]